MDNNEKKLSEVLLVGIDHSNPDVFTMVVGKKDTEKKETEILNIIYGAKAQMLYNDLTTVVVPEVKK